MSAQDMNIGVATEIIKDTERLRRERFAEARERAKKGTVL